MLVSASLLVWGEIGAGSIEGSPLVLDAGAPAELHEGLSRAGSASAFLTLSIAGLAGISGDWPAFVDRMGAMSVVVSSAYALKAYLKYRFTRQRPFVAAAIEDGHVDDLQSFPSGHSLLAWACVGDSLVAVARSRAQWWALPAVVAGATVTSVLRVAAGEHYVGDVVAGALIGILAGASVSALGR
jgi:undecaprenyl-diphosphatase